MPMHQPQFRIKGEGEGLEGICNTPCQNRRAVPKQLSLPRQPRIDPGFFVSPSGLNRKRRGGCDGFSPHFPSQFLFRGMRVDNERDAGASGRGRGREGNPHPSASFPGLGQGTLAATTKRGAERKRLMAAPREQAKPSPPLAWLQSQQLGRGTEPGLPRAEAAPLSLSHSQLPAVAAYINKARGRGACSSPRSPRPLQGQGEGGNKGKGSTGAATGSRVDLAAGKWHKARSGAGRRSPACSPRPAAALGIRTHCLPCFAPPVR